MTEDRRQLAVGRIQDTVGGSMEKIRDYDEILGVSRNALEKEDDHDG